MGVVTPDQMMERATALDADVRRLASAIESGNGSEGFKDGWRAFLAEWSAFYEGLGGFSGWIDRLWAGTDDQIDDYRRRLVEWQTAFRAEGGSVIGPAIDLPAPPATPLADLKWIVLGAAFIVGAIILYREVR